MAGTLPQLHERRHKTHELILSCGSDAHLFFALVLAEKNAKSFAGHRPTFYQVGSLNEPAVETISRKGLASAAFSSIRKNAFKG